MRFLIVFLLAAAPLVAQADGTGGLGGLMSTPGFESPAASAVPSPPDGPPIVYNPGFPDDTPNPGDEPAMVPVDGGLSLLALAGAGYAARKLRRRRREEE